MKIRFFCRERSLVYEGDKENRRLSLYDDYPECHYEENDNEKLTNYKKNNLKKIFRIERARKCLAEPYKTIIDNTFFIKKELYWWIDFYPKTTYYRLRGKAIRTFLEAYSYDD